MVNTSARPAILVTGGAGYIGSHCAKALHEAGYLPVCYDNLSSGRADFVKWGPLVTGDLADTQKLAACIDEFKMRGVVHFAAASDVRESMSNPEKYHLNNTAGTASLLQAMKQNGCDKIVFSSTAAVYGNKYAEPISETWDCEPINPYGESKLAAEKLIADYRAAHGIKAFCFRYFNVAGADPAGELGEARQIETHLIPRAIMAAKGQLPEFSIFGTDYDTPDGTAVRDYIHVVDLAVAHVSALAALLKGSAGGTYNLGTGTGFSVKQVLSALAEVIGRDVPHKLFPRRLGDPAILVADPSAARRDLAFDARLSDIKTMVETAWDWAVSLDRSASLMPAD
ncbi:UDP-glucose 4-epimerase GalE [soil metagenome]